MALVSYKRLSISKIENGYTLDLWWESMQGNIHDSGKETYQAKDVDEVKALIDKHIKKLS